MKIDCGEGRLLTEGAAESHFGNRKCHSIDLKHFAVGFLCGTCPETAGAHHLSICLHTSVLGSSENQPVQRRNRANRSTYMPAQKREMPTQASRDWIIHLAGFPAVRGSQSLGPEASSFYPSPSLSSQLLHHITPQVINQSSPNNQDYVENVIIPLKYPHLPQTPAQTGCPVYT